MVKLNIRTSNVIGFIYKLAVLERGLPQVNIDLVAVTQAKKLKWSYELDKYIDYSGVEQKNTSCS